jgi:hypothetical protein
MAKTSRGPRKEDRLRKDRDPRRAPTEGERRPGDAVRQRKDEEGERWRPEPERRDEY